MAEKPTIITRLYLTSLDLNYRDQTVTLKGHVPDRLALPGLYDRMLHQREVQLVVSDLSFASGGVAGGPRIHLDLPSRAADLAARLRNLRGREWPVHEWQLDPVRKLPSKPSDRPVCNQALEDSRGQVVAHCARQPGHGGSHSGRPDVDPFKGITHSWKSCGSHLTVESRDEDGEVKLNRVPCRLARHHDGPHQGRGKTWHRFHASAFVFTEDHERKRSAPRCFARPVPGDVVVFDDADVVKPDDLICSLPAGHHGDHKYFNKHDLRVCRWPQVARDGVLIHRHN